MSARDSLGAASAATAMISDSVIVAAMSVRCVCHLCNTPACLCASMRNSPNIGRFLRSDIHPVWINARKWSKGIRRCYVFRATQLQPRQSRITGTVNDLWTSRLGLTDYGQTVELQRSLRAAREAGTIPDTLLLLEHAPVVTTGHRTEPHEIALLQRQAVPVIATDRGGKATYHGPGQLVAYPIFHLHDHGSDIKAYVRMLEQAMIETLAAWGIDGIRREEYPGVWVQDAVGGYRKIGSIGVRVTRWVAYHGISLNVDCGLAPFNWFTPCGIPEVTMTTMAAECVGAQRAPDVESVSGVFAAAVERVFSLTSATVTSEDLEQALTREAAHA